MGLAVVTLRVTKSSCIVGDWVHGQCPQQLEDNHQTRVCVAARPATRFPSCGDSSEPLSVSANHLSGTLMGLMVITPPPLAQRTRIITWFLNDCAGYALAFHQRKKKKTAHSWHFQSDRLWKCHSSPTAGVWRVSGIPRRSGKNTRGQKREMERRKRHQGWHWSSFYADKCGVTHSPAAGPCGRAHVCASRGDLAFVYSPLVHVQPFNWIACSVIRKVCLPFNDPEFLPGSLTAYLLRHLHKLISPLGCIFLAFGGKHTE